MSPWAKGVWGAAGAVGAGALGVVAWQRGEPVNALWLVVATGCVYAIGYRFHSAWLMASVLASDPDRVTRGERKRGGDRHG